MSENETINHRLELLEKDNDRKSETFIRIFDKLEVLSETMIKNQMSIDITIKELEKMNARLENLESKPAKRWDNIITTAVTSTVAFVIGYVLNR